MSAERLPEPPDISGLNPQMMTTAELHSGLEELFGWLHETDAMPESQRPPEREVEAIRDAANMLLREQRERHFDESAPSGG